MHKQYGVEGRIIAGGIEVVVDGHHRSMMDALEQAGFAPEYHCREGVCGACRCTLISGEVEYNTTPLANLDAGEVLSCCARPKGTVVIKERPPIKKRRA